MRTGTAAANITSHALIIGTCEAFQLKIIFQPMVNTV